MVIDLLYGISWFLVQLVPVPGASISRYFGIQRCTISGRSIHSIFGVENSGDEAVFTCLFPGKMPFYLAVDFKSLMMCSQQKVFL